MRRSRCSAALATLVLLTTVIPAAAFPGTLPDGLDGVDRCPVTRTNDIDEHGVDTGGFFGGDFANDVLWTNLWMWGHAEVPVDAAHRNAADEAEDLKWAWVRLQPGRLTIDGRRLDGEAPPLRAWIPEGYGASGFQVTGITFPTPGCWQVTGHLLDVADPTVELGRLTFVVRVVYEGD